MARKNVTYKIKGMIQDYAKSIHNPEFSFENKNINITSKNKNSLLSIENSKGTTLMYLKDYITNNSVNIKGTCIGTATLNNNLILFVKDQELLIKQDFIYLIFDFSTTNKSAKIKKLYQGTLNFNINNPIESLSFYENEDIQKVYWVDGINTPRVINIKEDITRFANDSYFDFVRTIDFTHKINITKNSEQVSLFKSGTLQYAFSYFTRFGQETNIFYNTPLLYTSNINRGGKPDEYSNSTFNISLDNLDTSFDYIRIYSIYRSSIDTTPLVKKVVDLKISEIKEFIYNSEYTQADDFIQINYNSNTTYEYFPYLGNPETGLLSNFTTLLQERDYIVIKNADLVTLYYRGGEYIKTFSENVDNIEIHIVSDQNGEQTLSNNNFIFRLNYYPETLVNFKKPFEFLDNNLTGEIVDSTLLYYIGGEDIIANTIVQKDNTLFLGDITLKRPLLSNKQLNNKTLIFEKKELYSISKSSSNRDRNYYKPETLDKPNQNTFKFGDVYRFGIQAQHKTGKWSDVLFIGDLENNIKPESKYITDPYNPSEYIMYGSKAKLTINDYTFLQELYEEGFVNLRGVVVYPELTDRNIVAQGIVNPTLVNVDDANQGICNNLSSWFFRPESKDDPKYTLENRHGWTIPGFKNAFDSPRSEITGNLEIQSNRGLPERIYDVSQPNIIDNTSIHNFYIDRSVLTFHSPEIEFDERIQALDNSNLKMRLIGYTTLDYYNTENNINASAPYEIYGGQRPTNYLWGSNEASRGFSDVWFDRVVLAKNNDYRSETTNLNYAIFAWHAKRSLNNQPASENRTALLNNKQLAHYRFCSHNTYFNTFWEAPGGITNLGIYNDINDNLIKLNAVYRKEKPFYYKGSYDKIIGLDENMVVRIGGYPIIVKKPNTNEFWTLDNGMNVGGGGNWTDDELPRHYKVGTEPVRIRFKSTTHGVFGLNWTTRLTQYGDTVICNTLPSFKSTDIFDQNKRLFYSSFGDNKRITFETKGLDLNNGGFFIAELYRDNVQNRFGGNNLEAYKNNKWLPCGEPVSLLDQDGLPKTNVVIEYTEGDTFFQRYDCLKTYPASLEDVSSVVDMASFLVETHINLDGRYDKNRGKTNISSLNPNNINLLNNVYNQKNNYFNYNVLDYERFNLNTFPNTFTWTKTKLAGELIDTWTNLTLSSIQDVNGELGKIRSLNLFNDSLIGFQDNGLFTINFNNRVQISTSDGVPIELTNSGKVDGVRYISSQIGTKNKFSIVNTPKGIYFMDDNSKTINLFNGQINNISESKGMNSFFNKYLFLELGEGGNSISNPITLHTKYDEKNKNIYFNNKDYSLCYNESLETFTSFYSLDKVTQMFNIDSDFYSLYSNKSQPLLSNNLYLWLHDDGDYGKFHGLLNTSYIDYLINVDPLNDKIFDTAEIRADVFNGDDFIPGLKPFTQITGKTEYQVSGENTNDINFRQKFRVWRALIPRTSSAISNIFPLSSNKLLNMDRIRNTWANVTFHQDNTFNKKIIIQDVTFHYTI